MDLLILKDLFDYKVALVYNFQNPNSEKQSEYSLKFEQLKL